MTEVTTDRN